MRPWIGATNRFGAVVEQATAFSTHCHRLRCPNGPQRPASQNGAGRGAGGLARAAAARPTGGAFHS